MPIPTATYRIQLNPDFGFAETAAVVEYLDALAISHLYASPIFQSRPGSRHGYDGVDPNSLNPELGSAEDWNALVETVRDHAMGWLQDIVPNHLAFDGANIMLMDVLENGRHSEYRHFFDIDWDHCDAGLNGRLLVPVLGDRYPTCIENGEIKLGYDEEGFFAAYSDHRWPLNIDSYLEFLRNGLGRIEDTIGDSLPARNILEKEIFGDLRSLAGVQNRSRRRERVARVKQNLWHLYRREPVRQCIDAILRKTNGERGVPQSFDALERILDRQVFRPAYWKVAFREINYRRFFDINDLICLRQEDRGVFEHTHGLLGRLVAEKIIDGIRIDHVDGLSDPAGYLSDLRHRMGPEVFVAVEKILAVDESLPQSWPVQGTTGYEFAAAVNGLFVMSENAQAFTDLYGRFSGREHSWEQIVCNGKRFILQTEMAGELDNLTARIKAAAAGLRSGRDLTTHNLKAALVEILVRLPVYRTYIDPEGAGEADRTYLRTAAELAVLNHPRLQPEVTFLQRYFLDDCRHPANGNASNLPELRWQALRRFQQLSAPLMAKGCEDTALYVYNRLLSLNEVGDDPGRFGCRREDFHRFIQQRARQWPLAMNSSSTHDSKRSEDVRARLNVLSEIPQLWEDRLARWHELNRNRRQRHRGGDVPDRNEEYFIYQTLIGVWPADGRITEGFVERMRSYLRKAAREAKVHTSWLEPDEEYESRLIGFLDKILESTSHNRFRESLQAFAHRIAIFGFSNSLAQTVIKITAPGIPDFYQGSELLEFNLVDPDNRRPVDFVRRRDLLREWKDRNPGDLRSRIDRLLEIPDYDRIKFYTTVQTLDVRRRRASLFTRGRYLPLQTHGPLRRNLTAFARQRNQDWCLTIVPRFLMSAAGDERLPLDAALWKDTGVRLPENAPGLWRSRLTEQRLTTDGTLAAGELFRHFPVAVLTGEIP